jgi:anthranilate phosphoribosyltransferase
MSIREAISALAEKKDLNQELASQAFTEIMEGKATEAQIAAFITALRVKGETSEEIAAGVKVMESFMANIQPKVNGKLLDTCGTGGDKLNTFNISTTAMFS